MRKVLLDTETTGLDFQFDRVWEIACVEMIDYEPTGNILHYYLNPQKRLSEEAAALTNMTDDFLVNKPVFKQMVHEFLEFISGATIVAHNASFDVQMINAELKRCGLKPLDAPVIDTLEIARTVYPGGNNTLDSLCKKFKVSFTRDYHGALKDAQDLAGVYYYLMNAYGAKKNTLEENDLMTCMEDDSTHVFNRTNCSQVSAEELKAHIIFCKEHGIEY